MSVLERDPEATATRLEEWLTQAAGFADVHVDNVSIPGSTGWSNETVMFDATWTDAGERVERELVARIAPAEYSVFPDDTFAAQFQIMQALSRHTAVPVANVHWFEPSSDWFGKEFWIMARVNGDIAMDTPHYATTGWLHEASPQDQERAWWSGIEAMAAVHRTDLATIGDLGVRPGSGTVAEQLDHCERFLTWAKDGTTMPLARQTLDVLRRTAPAEPAEGPALSWGDARLSNLIYRNFEVVAVLDWEMVSLADPLLDVGWWLFADAALTQGMGAERLPGFPSAAETGERWSILTNRSADALGYYELLGGLRFTIIMLRMGKLLHDMGLVPDTFPHDNLISQALEQRI